MSLFQEMETKRIMPNPIFFLETFPEYSDWKRSDGESYFAPLFNFMYYIFLAPFKVEISEETGKYQLERHRFQLIGCTLVHLMTLLLTLPYDAYYIFSVFLSNASDLAALFSAVGNVASGTAVILWIKVLWMDQSKLLNFLQAPRIPQKRIWNFPVGRLKVAALCLYAAFMHSLFSWYMGLISSTADEPVVKLVYLVQNQFRVKDTSSLAYWPFTVVSGIAYVVFYVVVYLASGMYTVSRLIVMVLCLKFQALGCEFEKFLNEENPIKKVVDNFDAIRDAVDKGNLWSSSLILTHYLAILTFTACVPSLKFSDKVDFLVFYLIYTYIIYGVFIVIACDLPMRIKSSWKKWISRKRLVEKMTDEERFSIMTLALNIEGEPVGLSCSFFTITHQFLGSMFGLVITYGLLVYQKQAGTVK